MLLSTAMARHAAFLRAINVGGRVVKMDALRAHCEACGLKHVETFIASGNVIFESRGGADGLETKIEAALRAKLGYEVATFVRGIADLEAIAVRAAEESGGTGNVYVAFLKQAPPAGVRKSVEAMAGQGERFLFEGREFYWLTSGGVSDSKFSNAIFERAIKAPATFRNITTIRKIADKYAG